MVNDEQDGAEQVIESDSVIDYIVQKHQRDAKKFTINFGTGKNTGQHKLEAASDVECENWIKAIQLMIENYI